MHFIKAVGKFNINQDFHYNIIIQPSHTSPPPPKKKEKKKEESC